MCGRYVNAASTDDLTDEFDIVEALDDDLPPSWNVAPTDPVRIVVKRYPTHDREAPPVRQLRTVQWGLLPSWSTSRSGGAKLINARSETVTVKPAFKTAAVRRRCLAPSLGYFEWKRASDGRKVPYFLHDPAGRTLAMAGLYEIWCDESRPNGDPERWVWSCTIITHPAPDVLGVIHDRCPVVVPPRMQEDWLDCTDPDPAAARHLLDSMPEPDLAPRLVSPAVGNVKNNGPELIDPVG